MTNFETRDHELHWEVFVTPGIPAKTRNLPPGTAQLLWSPTSATLIYGKRDAVLIDALLTIAQAHSLGEWVATHRKHLTTIYLTHGHGDHCFGAGTLLQRFPDARLVATPEVVEMMRQQVSPQSLASFWHALFPGQISDQLVQAEALTGNVLDLEGRELVVVPSIGLVVAGDAAYNDVHLYLAESNAHTRHEWISALNTIEALHPRAVVAGHKRSGTDDDPRIIEETRQYIREFDRLAETATTARELYDQILSRNPERVNPGAIWASARAIKP
jgi:glyoxylase-like metal-dependent hydrolase (beta-lactamase superfamily II)